MVTIHAKSGCTLSGDFIAVITDGCEYRIELGAAQLIAPDITQRVANVIAPARFTQIEIDALKAAAKMIIDPRHAGLATNMRSGRRYAPRS